MRKMFRDDLLTAVPSFNAVFQDWQAGTISIIKPALEKCDFFRSFFSNLISSGVEHIRP
jgi:hypothetical protein